MELANIIEIPVENLFGHPKNPRKNVGDVTELAESIKANGLMQNLTVVPGHWCDNVHTEEGYTVIIGHRRLAAAKKAGIGTLPCAVRYDMPEKEQIATMIAENMQRVDLTIVEQAQSMQMMIDLGDTVEDVSEKTGLSKSTVRNRLKIASLDAEALKKSEGRQLSIGDYMKLMDIEDESTRNLVLLSIGTNNFAKEYDKAIRAQNDKKTKEKVLKYLSDNGYVELENTEGYISYHSFYGIDEKSNLDKEIGKPKEGCNFFSYKWGLCLYRERNEQDHEKEVENARRRRWTEETEHRINDITEEMYSRMRECFDTYTPKKADLELLKNAFIFSVFRNYARKKVTAELLELDVHHETPYSWNEGDYSEPLSESFKQAPERTLLAWLISQIINDRVAEVRYGDYTVVPNRSFEDKRDNFLKICDVLENFGFELADDEFALVIGTHPIFEEKYK